VKGGRSRDIKRLQKFYGVVASDQNRSILRWVTGGTILELGCGYGTLVFQAEYEGREAFGLDIEFTPLRMGKEIYPYRLIKLVQGDMGCLPFKDKSFHTVILRESLHHVSWRKILPEILRVCRKEIIIFEPNPNWVLRLGRMIIAHRDPEIPWRSLVNLLEQHGMVIRGPYFRDFVAFPLSGGFVGWELVPPIKFLYSLLIRTERIFQALFHSLRIEKAISWRYMVKGVLMEPEVGR